MTNSTRKIQIIVLCIIHVIFAVLAKIQSDWVPTSGLMLFTLAFGILISFTLFLKFSYALKFFNIFIYLGFYLKFCFHLIFSYPFNEPIGGFVGNTEQLLDFLNISAIAASSISLVTAIDWKYLSRKNLSLIPLYIPNFKKYYKQLFYLLIAAITLVAVINLKLGINISGLAAMTVLPRPLNALIGFLLTVGFSILITLFATNEFKINSKLTLTTILILFEGAFSTVSVVSRGIFLFHFFPYIFCLYMLRKELFITYKKLLLISISGFIVFIMAGVLVTKARSSLYDGYNLNESNYFTKNIFDFWSMDSSKAITEDNEDEILALQNSPFDDNRRYIFTRKYIRQLDKDGLCRSLFICRQFVTFKNQVLGLFVERWIGAEGLMAVVSYPEKDISLIYQSLIRRPKVGELDVFEKMNNSIYQLSQKYVFTSLPGPVAFFYYSGNMFIVFAGVFIFLMLMLGLQYGTEYILPNTFTKFQTSFFFAISFMQFGISPRPMLISILMLYCFLLFLRWVQMLVLRYTIKKV